MSGGWVAAGVAAATIGTSVYSSNQQSKASKRAANMQREASEKQLRQQEQEFNRQNQNEVDTSALLEANSGSETGSTMLTGASGVANDLLSLGKGSSLLGG